MDTHCDEGLKLYESRNANLDLISVFRTPLPNQASVERSPFCVLPRSQLGGISDEKPLFDDNLAAFEDSELTLLFIVSFYPFGNSLLIPCLLDFVRRQSICRD
jgi:hypothetical protein